METITLVEGKDYEIMGNQTNSAPLVKVKPKKKSKPTTIFQSLSYTLGQISQDKDIIFRYLEAFLNARPQTKENIALALYYHLYSDLNPHERLHTSYEDLLSMLVTSSSGRHKLDPSYIISAVSGGAHICNVQIAHILASISAVDVVNAVVREATKEEGSSYNDRKLLLEITGVVDKENKSGVTINNHNNTSLTQQVAIVEQGIPKFMGEIVQKDSLLREHYRKALKESHKDTQD